MGHDTSIFDLNTHKIWDMGRAQPMRARGDRDDCKLDRADARVLSSKAGAALNTLSLTPPQY